MLDVECWMFLNEEAIQICQLSLWIKTAARGKQLTSLDHTIREDNSVIGDKAVHLKTFDWQRAFPEALAQDRLARCRASRGRQRGLTLQLVVRSLRKSRTNRRAASAPAYAPKGEVPGPRRSGIGNSSRLTP